MARKHLSPITKENLRLHLIPAFGPKPFRRITQDDLTTFLGTFKSSRKKVRAGETTRRQCLGLLRQISADAVEDGLIDRVPFRTTGRRRAKIRIEGREMTVLDAQQAACVPPGGVGQPA